MNGNYAKLVAVTNFKGGVGKSTISSILGSKFDNKENIKACVFNISKGQSAEAINEVETIDYSTLLSIDSTTTVSEALAEMMPVYDYIFVDVGGEISNELVEIINFVHYFIIPFDDGARTFIDTNTYIESLFTSGIIEDKVHNICLVANKFEFDRNKYGNIQIQLDEIKEEYYEKLNQIAEENSLSFNLEFTSLSNSKTIKTMERDRVSIDTLVGTSAVAYGRFNKKVERMVKDIENHINKTLGE